MNGSMSGAPMAHGAPPLVHSTSLGSGAQWGHSMDGPVANQYLTHTVRALLSAREETPASWYDDESDLCSCNFSSQY